jgi:hypothetical protein
MSSNFAPTELPLAKKRSKIIFEYDQPHEMATAFGVRALGTALVVHFDSMAMMERDPNHISSAGSL